MAEVERASAALTGTGSVPVKPGQILGDKYRVDRVLGQGGMGGVVAATHLQLGQQVALKFLREKACREPVHVERFLREARAAVQIRSEHVARVLDVGKLEGGCPYMVMELLHGRDLGAELSRRGHLSCTEAVDYVLQACEAIAEAHAVGVVHRDLKPTNLFLTARPDGSPLVKVLDFGISKVIEPDAEKAALTITASTFGSPVYMSPEQVRSAKNVDVRADIWSLGIILHELLAGRPPFLADTVPALFAQIVADPPAPLRAFRSDAPEQLEAAILRALAKDVSERFQSVAQLALELRAFASEAGILSVQRIQRTLEAAGVARAPGSEPSPSGNEGRPRTNAETMVGWGKSSTGSRRRTRTLRWVVFALLLMGLGAATVVLTKVRPWRSFIPSAAVEPSRRPAAGRVSSTGAPPAVPSYPVPRAVEDAGALHAAPEAEKGTETSSRAASRTAPSPPRKSRPRSRRPSATASGALDPLEGRK